MGPIPVLISLLIASSVARELNSGDTAAFNELGDKNTLAEAIKVLDRRKKDVASHKPYSSFRPLSGAHR